MNKKARLAAKMAINQITPEYLDSLPALTRRKVKSVRKALGIILVHDRHESDVWDALDTLKRAIGNFELSNNQEAV